MPIQSWGKSGVLAYFELKIGCFGHFFEIWTSIFFSPIININIKWQTQLKVNWTQIDHFGLQKTIKMDILKHDFGQVSVTKIPTPPKLFNVFV